MAEEPLFKEIDIANFGAQLRRDRFPDPELQYEQSNAQNILQQADNIDHLDDNPETYSGPPYVAVWRMNLTALSQKHNLYFVASRDEIHCYIPRDLKQTLPPTPDLIVDLPVSEEGFEISGVINPSNPHSINHMIVGNLGDLEIILVACDDGDILAFYTHKFQDELARSDLSTKVREIRPFFHQNVGISAWGLAIHQKSRLIAASSNLREVTIFVHGYSETTGDETPHDQTDDEKFPTLITLERVPKSFRDRDQNYRIVLSLGVEGQNIPTIDFMDDKNGEADLIIVANIVGTTWLVNPWDGTFGKMQGIHGETYYNNNMAWGVRSLSLENFRSTSNIHQALGFKLENGRPTGFLQPTSSRHRRPRYLGIHFNATPPFKRTTQMAIRGFKRKPVPVFEGFLDQDGPTLTSDLNDMLNRDAEQNASPQTLSTSNPIAPSTTVVLTTNPDGNPSSVAISSVGNVAGGTDTNQVIAQWETEGERETEFLWRFLHLPRRMRVEVRNWEDLMLMGRKFRWLEGKGAIPIMLPEKPRKSNPYFDSSRIFFRTYAHDMELVTFSSTGEEIGTRLMDPLAPGLTRDVHALQRFNLLFLIPELNLIVVGSQGGKVCLLTLTRVDDPKGILPPFLSFRLDQILPFISQRGGFQPACPLLGMAVSPLQQSNTYKIVGLARRWRLILHYYDHTILSYELGRDEDGLIVF